MRNIVVLPSCDRRNPKSCLMAFVLHFLVIHPKVTLSLCAIALRNSSCRDWGNLLVMLKGALPRHAAFNDLLKKHISTPFPIFQTSSFIYSSSFHLPDSFLLAWPLFSSSCSLFLLFFQTSPSFSFCSNQHASTYQSLKLTQSLIQS